VQVLFGKKINNKKEKDKNFKKRKKWKKKGEIRAGLYPPGIESRNTTPHAIVGLAEVKKASFPPFSTTPCVLAHKNRPCFADVRQIRFLASEALPCKGLQVGWPMILA
jgi:hypothetical protein